MIEEIKTKKKKFFNNSVLFFLTLIVIVIFFSIIGSVFGWQASYTRVDAISGDTITGDIVAVNSLLSGPGLRYILGGAIANFVTFAPLGLLLVSLIGIGIAYKSGFLTTLFGTVFKKFNKFWLTFFIVLLGIISSFAGDLGYVIIIPIAAIIFLSNNRNPLVGILASFVSIASGYGVNLFLSNLDYSLAPYTNMAAKTIDENFNMNMYGNIFFVMVASILLALLITYITEKVVIRRVPKYKRDEMIIEDVTINRKEKRGLVLALGGGLILLLIFVYMIIPGLPLSGILLDKAEPTYLGKLFGANAYFQDSLVYIIAVLLTVMGFLYGLGARTIKNGEQFASTLFDSLSNIGSILILIFFASQFIAILKYTNLDDVIVIWLMNAMHSLNFSSVPLILLLFIFVGIANIFMPSIVSKWVILSPVVVPMFMQANITPEFTQAIYRLSATTTTILTPTLAYFVIFLGYLEIYNKEENTVSIRDCYKMLWPYAIAIACLWLFIIVSWYIVGLPIGINALPTV